MALKHLATLLADYVAPDASGRHTLVRLYQNVAHVGPFPCEKLPFCVLVELQGEGESFRIVLEGPPGSYEVAKGVAEKPKDLPEYQQWATGFVMELTPGVFPEPGVYAIVVYSGDEELHRREFGVRAASSADLAGAIAVTGEASLAGLDPCPN